MYLDVFMSDVLMCVVRYTCVYMYIHSICGGSTGIKSNCTLFGEDQCNYRRLAAAQPLATAIMGHKWSI